MTFVTTFEGQEAIFGKFVARVTFAQGWGVLERADLVSDSILTAAPRLTIRQEMPSPVLAKATGATAALS